MNKHSVLQNNSKRVQDAEQEQQVENTKAREEAGNGNSSPETRTSSENIYGPAANQDVEADKEDALTNSHQSEDSDEIEATSSNDSSKRSSPRCRNMRHRKARLLESETVVSSNSRKAFMQQDQHMPSPSRERNYAYPLKRYSNPIAPTERRSKLCWTEEEETALREAMAKFTPRDNGPIPWVQILEYGMDVFHRTRLPCDLMVKWLKTSKQWRTQRGGWHPPYRPPQESGLPLAPYLWLGRHCAMAGRSSSLVDFDGGSQGGRLEDTDGPTWRKTQHKYCPSPNAQRAQSPAHNSKPTKDQKQILSV